MHDAKIAVIGSLNLDLVLQCYRFPKPGETISALSYQQIPGGKGANQAVAAALACQGTEMQVAMIGRIGDDDFGKRLLHSLQSRGANCDQVLRTVDCESGLAFITVQSDGQNSIAIVGGANARLSADDIAACRSQIAESDLVLLQLEVPLATVEAAIRIARECHTPVLLDPAPIPETIPDFLYRVDFLTPNQHEASALADMPIESLEDVERAASKIRERGAQTVIVTLGADGAYVLDDQGGRHIPAWPCEAIDTTAAGDAFAGAFAVKLVESGEVDQAISWGNAAGAIAASRLGAQPSMGNRQEINQLWSKQ